MKTITMTEQDEFRFGAINSLIQKKNRRGQTMKMLDLSKRQVKRLRKRVREHGTEGVIHKGRGKRSNRKTPDDLREKTEKLLKEKYPDFGPKFASEKLRDDHGIEHSKETVRVMMVGLGLRKSQTSKRKWRLSGMETSERILRGDGAVRWVIPQMVRGKERRALSPCLD